MNDDMATKHSASKMAVMDYIDAPGLRLQKRWDRNYLLTVYDTTKRFGIIRVEDFNSLQAGLKRMRELDPRGRKRKGMTAMGWRFKSAKQYTLICPKCGSANTENGTSTTSWDFYRRPINSQGFHRCKDCNHVAYGHERVPQPFGSGPKGTFL